MTVITFYTYEYPPICGTGPGNTMRLLSSSLIEEGFKVKAVTLKFGKYSNLMKEERVDGVSVYRLQLAKNERLLFALQAGVFSNFNRDKVSSDIIHAMDSRAAGFIYKDKSPLIVNINDYVASAISLNPFKKYPWHATDSTKRYFYENTTKLFEFLSFKRADGIISNSNFSTETVSSYYNIPKNKVFTIYKGIDVSEFKGSAEKDIDVLFVGGNIEKKGIAELIDAAFMVKKDFPDVKFVAIGRCSDRYLSNLKNKAKSLGLKDNITFIYNLPHNKLVDYYHRARVFALPTYREAFGLVILEAMASKVPVVATDVGGVPEIVNSNNGFLIPVYDSKQLAEKISFLLSNPSKAKAMGIEGLNTVSTKFNLNKMVKAYIRVYEKFIR